MFGWGITRILQRPHGLILNFGVHCIWCKFRTDDLEGLKGSQGLKFRIQRVEMGWGLVGELHLNQDSVKSAYSGHLIPALSHKKMLKNSEGNQSGVSRGTCRGAKTEHGGEDLPALKM